MLNTKFFLIPISVSILYTIYNQYKEMSNVKKQLRRLSKRVLKLELLNKKNTDISNTAVSSTLTINTNLANSTSNINALENNDSTIHNTMSDKVINDNAISDNSLIDKVINDNVIKENIVEDDHDHDYEYIEHNNDMKNSNKIQNRKKSNSMSEAIWAGITDNIIYF